MLNVAIVGSNGFIGSNLAQEISKYDNLFVFLFGKNEQNLSGTNLPYNVIDYKNHDLIKQQFKQIDLVYYLASSTIPSSSWENPKLELENNLLPFLEFMEAISRLQVKKIVFISSAGTVYGPSESKVSESTEKQPFSPYGITKLTIEYYLNYFKIKHNISYDIYRVSNVYGVGQNTSKGLGIINTFIEQIVLNHKINVFGDGENIRNYINVKDVVKLMTYSITSKITKSNIFNIASNDTISINQLIEIIKNIIDENFEVVFSNNRKSDNSFINIDNTKILSTIPNYKFISLNEGIQGLYFFIKNNFK